MAGLPVVFGGAMIGPPRAFNSAETIGELYDVLEKGGVKIIDSAQLYEGSERMIGETNGGSRFTIDTKWKGGFAGVLNNKEIVESAKVSIEQLKVKKGDSDPLVISTHVWIANHMYGKLTSSTSTHQIPVSRSTIGFPAFKKSTRLACFRALVCPTSKPTLYRKSMTTARRTTMFSPLSIRETTPRLHASRILSSSHSFASSALLSTLIRQLLVGF
jgi:hypothetical protein